MDGGLLKRIIKFLDGRAHIRITEVTIDGGTQKIIRIVND